MSIDSIEPARRHAPREGTTGAMTAARVAGLIVIATVAFFASAAGPQVAEKSVVIMAAAGVTFYFLPTIEASLRKHPSLSSIVLINVFLGWSLIGWVVAIAWACAGSSKPPAAARTSPSAQPAPASPAPGAAVATSIADELQKLVALKAQGTLTEEEFAALKRKVLS